MVLKLESENIQTTKGTNTTVSLGLLWPSSDKPYGIHANYTVPKTRQNEKCARVTRSSYIYFGRYFRFRVTSVRNVSLIRIVPLKFFQDHSDDTVSSHHNAYCHDRHRGSHVSQIIDHSQSRGHRRPIHKFW